MNVGIPGAGDPNWFYGIMAGMVLMALALYIYGRRRRWFADYEVRYIGPQP